MTDFQDTGYSTLRTQDIINGVSAPIRCRGPKAQVLDGDGDASAQPA
jgi:hypothetical protein